MRNLCKSCLVLIQLFLSFAAFQLNAGEVLENYSGQFVKEVIHIEGIKNEGANAMCIDGDILYCGAGRYIYALDISSDPLKPVVLSSVEIYGLVRQMTVQNGILYAAPIADFISIFVICITHILLGHLYEFLPLFCLKI